MNDAREKVLRYLDVLNDKCTNWNVSNKGNSKAPTRACSRRMVELKLMREAVRMKCGNCQSDLACWKADKAEALMSGVYEG